MKLETVSLKVLSAMGQTKAACAEEKQTSLVYDEEYEPGDRIMLSVSKAGGYYVLQLEDTLAPALVYVTRPEAEYRIPHGDDRIVFSPRTFPAAATLSVRAIARPEEVAARRNLAFNPYDRHGDTGIYPHARANVETRGEAVFAAYNAIDGIYENGSHGEWPTRAGASTGDLNAEWTLSFGRPVGIDELRLTLRADFPHDSWWGKRCRRAFSDGSEETLS